MVGYSKWSKVQRIKGLLDVKRGAMHSKLVKEITIAARFGGGDLSGDPHLQTAVNTAKAQNMPKDNIERAIKKGSGKLEGTHIVEALDEVHAPGGAARKEKPRFVTQPMDRFYAVADALKHGKVVPAAQRLIFLPVNQVVVTDESVASQMLHLHEALDDSEDTSPVYSHFDIPEDFLAKLSA